MQTTLTALTLVMAAVGLVYSNLRAVGAVPRETKEALRKLLWLLFALAAALVVVGFVATLPTRHPFSPGLTLGWGFLIGGVLGLYCAWEGERSYEGARWVARGVGLLAAAVLGVSSILLIFRGYPNEALVGYSLGAVLVAAVWRSCMSPLRARQAHDNAGVVSDRGVELFALSAVALAVGARLGTEHFGCGAEAGIARIYWTLPALLAGVAVLGGIIPVRLASGPSTASGWWRPLALALIATGAAVMVAALMAWKIFGGWGPALAFLSGAVGFALAAWVACEADGGDEEQAQRPTAEAFGIALLSLAVVAIAFKILHGYGEALALSGGLAIVVLVSASQAKSRQALAGPLLTGGFTIVLLLALYRLFLERNGAGFPLDMQQHYNYLAVALGALSAFGFLAYGHRTWQIAKSASDERTALRCLIAQTPLLGLGVVLTPMAVLVVFGLDALSGFLIGLVLTELLWMLLITWTGAEERALALASAPHPYVVGMSLVAIQFSPLLLSLGDGSRALKSSIVMVFVIVGVLWVVVKAVMEEKRGAAGGEGVD